MLLSRPVVFIASGPGPGPGAGGPPDVGPFLGMEAIGAIVLLLLGPSGGEVVPGIDEMPIRGPELPMPLVCRTPGPLGGGADGRLPLKPALGSAPGPDPGGPDPAVTPPGSPRCLLLAGPMPAANWDGGMSCVPGNPEPEGGAFPPAGPPVADPSTGTNEAEGGAGPGWAPAEGAATPGGREEDGVALGGAAPPAPPRPLRRWISLSYWSFM
mmetsp:Transcript_50538/g.124211  ORF Transcript_50538/g.124211 Transcript_50538/m.124211 type:complete len:212 (-) Transcript_50538:446-1081(-)